MAKFVLDFDKQCHLAGLPKPVAELAFAKGLGRRWRFDWAWVEWKVALEVEGGVWRGGRHTRGKGYIADMAKYSEAAILGWLVLRLTPTDLQKMGVVLVARALISRNCPAPAAAVLARGSIPFAASARRRKGARAGTRIRKAIGNTNGNGRLAIPKR